MYDKNPFVAVGSIEECLCKWDQIVGTIVAQTDGIVCVECYPGVFLDELETALRNSLLGWLILRVDSALLSDNILQTLYEDLLSDDPVFGRMSNVELEDFFNPELLWNLQQKVSGANKVVVFGTGATLVCPKASTLVYADMARWELQRRQRMNLIPNLGLHNQTEHPSLKYKRAFFLDWRAADRTKQRLLPRIDYLLDTNVPDEPRLIRAETFHRALSFATIRPFRVVPFFDPGPWGGHWMERVCGLPDKGEPNHAWCFDCVPEENSLLLGFGDTRVEIPAIDLVLTHPRELLGEYIYQRFGAEFPIRFDFLDTMGGGNLSLQVHPLTDYIREHFGMKYTQDESYYLLDAEPNAHVFLGLKNNIDPVQMAADLKQADESSFSFQAEQYVNQFPAQKHDHFLIPAGTIHCSGKDCMVLEISATPYIFTFKLWDWGRLGLDGRRRPIHLKQGLENIQWDRTTQWVRESLINQFVPIAKGSGWREERTGLHQSEFIETRRHWFTHTVPHHTRGTVHVLNLVEGDEAIVESPEGAFDPFIVHYAETFIVPAAVGAYTIRPHGSGIAKECATILAYVRNGAA